MPCTRRSTRTRPGPDSRTTADAYLAVGGFAPLRTGEDHALWNALHARPRVSSRKLAVTTSARSHARAPDGFSRFLALFDAVQGAAG